jgi:DNA-binding NarL/FixJ family response regulator
MRVFWEQTGVLLPIYRLAASGTSDAEIAEKLRITEA